MEGVKKLEEKLAETKDPVIRKQLQELLEERRKKEKKMSHFLIIAIVLVGFYLIATMLMNGYFERRRTQMKIEHIQEITKSYDQESLFR